MHGNPCCVNDVHAVSNLGNALLLRRRGIAEREVSFVSPGGKINAHADRLIGDVTVAGGEASIGVNAGELTFVNGTRTGPGSFSPAVSNGIIVVIPTFGDIVFGGSINAQGMDSASGIAIMGRNVVVQGNIATTGSTTIYGDSSVNIGAGQYLAGSPNIAAQPFSGTGTFVAPANHSTASGHPSEETVSKALRAALPEFLASTTTNHPLKKILVIARHDNGIGKSAA